MIDVDPELVAWFALGAAVLSVLLLGAVTILALRLRRLRRDLHAAFDVGSGEDVLAALGRHDQDLAGLRRDLTTVHANTEHLRELARGAVSRVGVVRYDAFGDMGGALSFSAALLDERADGVVISAINGRTETRCYAKPVAGGTSEHNLSREEEAAVAAAIDGRPASVMPPDSGRRRRRAS